LEIKLNSKTKIFFCENLNQMTSLITEIIDNNPDLKILPFFTGDAFSKYGIKTYNKSF